MGKEKIYQRVSLSANKQDLTHKRSVELRTALISIERNRYTIDSEAFLFLPETGEQYDQISFRANSVNILYFAKKRKY